MSISHMLFELNCSYHFLILYKEKIYFYSKYKSIDKLLAKLKELMIVCDKNFYHLQKLQKCTNNKDVKPKTMFLVRKIS